MIGIRYDDSAWAATFRNLRDRAPVALARALNRTAASVRTVMVRDVANDLGIKQAIVRDRLSLANATQDHLTATLSASVAKIPLIEFNARAAKRAGGVTARLAPPGQGRYPHAFIATMRSGHTGVFERTAGKYMQVQKSTWRHKRQAIHELHSPSIAHVFTQRSATAIAIIDETMNKNLVHEIEFLRSSLVA